MRQYTLSEIKNGRIIGDFKIVEVYPEGRGGMSRVVRARPIVDSDLQAALKISRTGGNKDYFFAAIQKEVEILQKLDHRGVVQLRQISSGKNPYKERAVQIVGTPWFFGMECLQGGSLEAYLRGLGPLSLSEAAAICHQVGAALEYIHGRGFAHNDVKPDNILFRRELKVGDRLEPVLIDFGVAAKLVKAQLDGSVVYMAPERLQESRDPSAPEVLAHVDPSKADVWRYGNPSLSTVGRSGAFSRNYRSKRYICHLARHAAIDEEAASRSTERAGRIRHRRLPGQGSKAEGRHEGLQRGD